MSRWCELHPLRAPLLLGALSLPGAAPAAASDLSWDGPSDCASRDALSFELERSLGLPLERAGRLKFDVRVERSESMASARLEVTSLDGSGHGRMKRRLLVAEDCSTLVDTLAVAIGLAIGASEMQRPEPATAMNAASASPAAAPEPSAAPAAVDSAAVDSAAVDSAAAERAPANDLAAPPPGEAGARLRPSVFLSLVGDGGSLPDPALGAALGAALQSGRAAARLSGTLLLDQQVELTGLEQGGTAEVGLGFGTLQGCLDAAGAPERWVLPLCVGLDVGQIWGRGVNLAGARREASWWVAPRFDAGLFWPLPGSSLRAGGWLTASAPLRRDEFIVDQVGAVHRPGPVVGRVSLGIDASLE